MEIAWSMPPDSVPTYLSHVVVNSATSCIDNRRSFCMLCPFKKSPRMECDSILGLVQADELLYMPWHTFAP